MWKMLAVIPSVICRIRRSDFGINAGLPRFSPEVKLAIQVEAVKQ